MKKYTKVPNHLKPLVNNLEDYQDVLRNLIIRKDKTPLKTLPELIVQFQGLYEDEQLENGEELQQLTSDFTEKMGFYVNAIKGYEGIDPATISMILGFLGGGQEQKSNGLDISTVLLIVSALALVVIIAVKA
jgi:hypothetical protein